MESKLIDKVIRCSYKDDASVNTYKNQKYPDHLHDFYEIMILFKDNISFVTDESVQHLYANNLIIIPPLKYHHAQVTESTDYKRLILWFTINIEGHKEFDQLLKNISVVNFSENEEIISYIYMFLNLIHHCDKKHLYEIAEAFITNLLFTIRYSNVVYEKQIHFNPIVAEVVEYLNSNLHQQNTLKALSKHFAISSSHLAKLFKSTMHISIINYVREKQLLQAKKDILDGKKPTLVYFDYGFNDYSSFYKSFKKQFGVSPNKIK
jgi:AraC-like DNA-binding protein